MARYAPGFDRRGRAVVDNGRAAGRIFQQHRNAIAEGLVLGHVVAGHAVGVGHHFSSRAVGYVMGSENKIAAAIAQVFHDLPAVVARPLDRIVAVSAALGGEAVGMSVAVDTGRRHVVQVVTCSGVLVVGRGGVANFTNAIVSGIAVGKGIGPDAGGEQDSLGARVGRGDGLRNIGKVGRGPVVHIVADGAVVALVAGRLVRTRYGVACFAVFALVSGMVRHGRLSRNGCKHQQ